MAGYTVTFDRAQSIVFCRITSLFQDDDLPGLASELSAAVETARRAGPLRALWDNRVGRVLAPDTAAAVRAILVDPSASQDRIAIVVRDSMAKVRARPSMVAVSELFASENAALTWLSVKKSAAA